LEASAIRVFIVDDYEPIRRFVRATLGNSQNFQVIGEASDGLEAVHKAQELQPDLIVLDIGLPTLNGIEVARRIRKLCPGCRIILLSQEASADLAREAFRLGAMGYVVKAHAGSELLAAIEAVSQGRQFVSKGLSGHQLFQQQVESAHRHRVQFYVDDEAFLSGVTGFIEAGLKAGNPV
jgi:DNA-binding NarL/FixJ family response regulator